MPIKVVIINLDSVLLNVDVSGLISRLRELLKIDSDLRVLIAEAILSFSDKSKAEKIDNILSEFEERTAEEAYVDQNDLEAICTLKAIGVKLALVTMRRRKSAEKALERTGLKDLFDVIITRDDEPEKTLQLIRACTSLGHKVEEALYVGFSRADVVAGVQAGCLVATPHRVIQALNKTIRIGSLHELLDVFKFELLAP
ncbi:MAG: HAD hydrolase-like protein [Candidatus Nezhaarchaeales archaeon]